VQDFEGDLVAVRALVGLGMVCCALCMVLAACNNDECVDGTIPIEPPVPMTVDIYPRWSPVDTGKVAYTHLPQSAEEMQEFGGSTVWIVNPTDSSARFVALGTALDWTPDGGSILLKRERQLWLVDLSTNDERNLGAGIQDFYGAVFSPCGRKIAYVVDEAPLYGVWILDLDSLSSHWIYHGYGPDWFPDGSIILCDSLIMIDEQGNRLGKVPYDSKLGFPGYGRWSPDGTTIAFVAHLDNQPSCIWTVTPNGSGLKAISCGGTAPSWSPGGSMLAYAAISADGKASAIWVMSADGSDHRQITFPKPSEESP
jgi:Tol biopolymer transport system component